MNHLRLFENYKENRSKNEISEIYADIKDILLPLEDDNIHIYIWDYVNSKIRIDIRDEWHEDNINLDLYKNDFKRLFKYLKLNKFEFTQSKFSSGGIVMCPECGSIENAKAIGNDDYFNEDFECTECYYIGNLTNFLTKPIHMSSEEEFWKLFRNEKTSSIEFNFIG